MRKIVYFINYFIKWTLIGALIGISAGVLSALFLLALALVTEFRLSHSWIIILLPIVGIGSIFAYQHYGQNAGKGNNLVIAQGQGGTENIPIRLIPLVFIGTVMAHLTGASVGREGTAVQMGGALADWLQRILKLQADNRKILITAGMGAGFSAIFGTPIAGSIFALEVLVVGRLETKSLYPVFLSSVIADQITRLFPIHHSSFIVSQVPALSVLMLLKLFIAGACFGLVGGFFAKMIALLKRTFREKINQPYLVIFLGSILIIAFAQLITTRYLGLSLPIIEDAFSGHSHWYDFIGKFFLTVFSLGIGFQGGEVTPLFEIGASLGANLSTLLQLPLTFIVALGYVSVFAAATNTPIACLLMGVELFGGNLAVPLFFVIIISFLFSGKSGIYSAQLGVNLVEEDSKPFLQRFFRD